MRILGFRHRGVDSTPYKCCSKSVCGNGSKREGVGNVDWNSNLFCVGVVGNEMPKISVGKMIALLMGD